MLRLVQTNASDERISKCPAIRAQPAEEEAQGGCNNAPNGKGMVYGDYLQLDKVLSAQKLQSELHGHPVPTEHLFIITHQAYELWFRQIIYDLDNIRRLFMTPDSVLDETQTLKIVSGLDRTVRILKLLVDQVLILETMSPLEFVEFRKYLSPASGFQSLQFRLMENKLGLRPEKRVRYNQEHYKDVFRSQEDRALLDDSESSPSLLMLVEKWLERTPGLDPKDYNFWNRYCRSVRNYLDDLEFSCEEGAPEQDQEMYLQAQAEFLKTKKSFESILDPKVHDSLKEKGERNLSHRALQGALMISLFRHQPRFSQPYQILVSLMDIDSLLTKWRYNHVMLVQRMLGNKQGTGGSSGYMCLRSTISDRYKVFLDLFTLSSWLLPPNYIPELSPKMRRRLSRSPSCHRDLLRVTDSSSDSDDNSHPTHKPRLEAFRK